MNVNRVATLRTDSPGSIPSSVICPSMGINPVVELNTRLSKSVSPTTIGIPFNRYSPAMTPEISKAPDSEVRVNVGESLGDFRWMNWTEYHGAPGKFGEAITPRIRCEAEKRFEKSIPVTVS